MNRDDIRKLLGGYATDTLTPEEQQALFRAALDDQELFDELAREQALRDLLHDPAAKAGLLAALDDRPVRWYEQLFAGWRPLAAVAAMAGVSALAVVVWQGTRVPKPALVARATLPPAPNPEPLRATEPDQKADLPAAPAAAPPPAAKPKTAVTASKDQSAPEDRLDKGKVEADSVATLKKEEAPALANAAPPAAGQGLAPAAPPAEPAAPRRSFSGGAVGGVVGGILPGQPSNAPAAAPPPPPAQQAVAPFVQQQQSPGIQAQQVREQSEKALADAVVIFDAEQIFYGRDREGGGGGAARKKAAAGPARPVPAAGVANSVALGVSTSRSEATANLGVRYMLLRKSAAGVFEPVPAGDLKSGDVIELQIEANTSGVLKVESRSGSGKWREVATHDVNAHEPYITRALRAGETEVQVRLNRKGAGAQPAAGRDSREAGAIQRKSTGDTNYVVAPSGARQLEFVIPLNYR